MIFKKYKRYGSAVNSHDLLKFLAILLMVIDHMGDYIYPEETWLRVIGRLSMPIFLFLVGYTRKHTVKRDIVFFACSTVIVDLLVGFPMFPLNILFTIIIARWFINICEQRGYLKDKQIMILWVTLVIWYPVSPFVFDYGTLGIMFAVCGYIMRNKERSFNGEIFVALTFLFHFMTIFFLYEGITIMQNIMLIITLTLLYLVCRLYRLRTFKREGWLYVPMLFISRYSLEVYALQLMVFHVVATQIISPQDYQSFQWIRG